MDGNKTENIILSEVRLRRTKATCSPSYEDYRSTTNVAILWVMSHTKGRLLGRDRSREENQNLECD
jgi:hypothetical protein